MTHVTGFATTFGYNLAIKELMTATGLFLVPFYFGAGSFCSALLIDRQLQKHEVPRVRATLGLILFLMVVVLILEVRFPTITFYVPDSSWSFLVANLLALASGVQNGMSTSLYKQNIRTTHLSGPTTDLAIGIARLIFPIQNRSVFSDFIISFLRLGTISAFIFGSVLSAIVFIHLGAIYALAIPVLLTAILLTSSFYVHSPICDLKEPMGILK